MVRVTHRRVVTVLRVVVLGVAVMLSMRLMLCITRRLSRTRRGLLRFMSGVLRMDRDGHRQYRDDRYPQGGFDRAHSSTLTSRNMPASIWKKRWQ
jgi:hypothetical protein